jgi:hydroxymethylpyrimidine/phosphomethylpyrimidine kinase
MQLVDSFVTSLKCVLDPVMLARAETDFRLP